MLTTYYNRKVPLVEGYERFIYSVPQVWGTHNTHMHTILDKHVK